MTLHSTTRLLREGQCYDVSDSHGEPVALTSAYSFKSAAEAAGRFRGTLKGNVYSRFTNPTVHAFERRIAALDRAEDAVAFASGMAAIAAVAHAWVNAGQNIVCARDVFGTTLSAFGHYFGKLGIDFRTVGVTRLDEWRAAIDDRTALVFFETPSNPTQCVADIGAIASIAHEHGARLVVDNTLMTPLNQRPLELGADVVIQSAGKHIDGQGRCVAGVVSGSEALMHDLRAVLRSLGSCLGSMDAWLLLKSVETLPLRIDAAGRTAAQLADWLASHELVGTVFHTSLPDHPQRELIRRQQQGFGCVVSFEVGQTSEHAWRFIDALQLVSIATNIGDSRTMITHPASTTHARLSADARNLAGISDSLVRLSVGLEHPDDLIADLEQAMRVASQTFADAGTVGLLQEGP
jgi:O-succinylhomoserine sulfhydrylase